ncbi:MAG: hypothetical protein QOJ21_2744, partial [Solirubrobacteraceae bacterium]|nr:hypothetical protein [Solirubrobacteraceae bacterium]
DALAKELRSDGRREEAAEVKALRKPSVAAWGVNQAVRSQPKATRELWDAGDALIGAQEALLAGRGDAAGLRGAVERERSALAELVEAAQGLLTSAGRDLGDSTIERVRETLHAAAIERDAREQVAPGRVTREMAHAGLGGIEAAPATVAAPATDARGSKGPAKGARGSKGPAKGARGTKGPAKGAQGREGNAKKAPARGGAAAGEARRAREAQERAAAAEAERTRREEERAAAEQAERERRERARRRSDAERELREAVRALERAERAGARAQEQLERAQATAGEAQEALGAARAAHDEAAAELDRARAEEERA